MRIQNNVTAMNTHRMYTMNNDAVAASAKKLSSGYRINSAADDAAGLAISEKMRSQIRGLSMAAKNSQDAISLVQTAEGALQETQNMLQRMNELAVQAATGTNEDLDRTALSKEFEQLKREINDIAEQTNFNNMKILDGSLSYEGFQRSAATAGVNNTITEATATTDAAAGALSKVDGVAAKDGVTAVQGKYETGAIALDDFSGDIKGGDVLEVTIKLADGRELTGLTNKVTAAAGSGANATLAEIAAALTGAAAGAAATATSGLELTFADGSSTDTYRLGMTTAGVLNVIGPATGTSSDVKFNDGIEISFKVHASEVTGREGTTIDLDQTQSTTPANTVDAVGGVTASAATATYTFDMSQVKVGDTLTVGGNTYEVASPTAVVDNNGQLENGNYAVIWNGETGDDSDFAQNLVAVLNGTAVKGQVVAGGTQIAGTKPATTTGFASAAVAGTNSITLTGGTPTTPGATTTTAALSDKGVELVYGAETDAANPYEGRTNTVEFDVSKMKEGDTFNFTISGQDEPVSVTYDGKMSRAEFMDYVKGQFAGVDNAEVKGNAVIIKDAKVDIELDESWKNQAYAGSTNAIRIQVGALENEQLSISIDAMNTKGLGLEDSFLTVAGQSTDQNIDSAGAAITAVRAAINKVSDQRATLGAMQNRLDHKIANLNISTENLTAAESRIRDVDMAEEMTNFTKNNILSQAATAMLAQANALPQNVLSLLG